MVGEVTTKAEQGLGSITDASENRKLEGGDEEHRGLFRGVVFS